MMNSKFRFQFLSQIQNLISFRDKKRPKLTRLGWVSLPKFSNANLSMSMVYDVY